MSTDRSALVSTSIPWIARLGWLALAAFGGAAVQSAIDGRSAAVRGVATFGGWTLWTIVAAALAIPSVWSLTIARVGTPLALAVAIATGVAGAAGVDVGVLALCALITCLAAFSAEFGQSFVQASAYGDEVRLPLRPPAAAGAAAVATWLVWALCLIAGPLLLAARSWVGGAVLTLVALAGVVVLVPRWQRLAQRWLVLVPAGLVLHDPVVLADTVMLRTSQIGGLRLAPADTAAADLTGPASGYAVEITATESITTVFAFTPSQPHGRAIHMTAFLVSPSRPGLALRAAARRGLHVS
jgi:hypothetical protein